MEIARVGRSARHDGRLKYEIAMYSRLSQSDAVKTISSKTADDYQKAVAFSPNGKLIATGSSNGELAVLKYPSLKNAFPTSKFGEEEIYDLDFSPDSDRIAVLSDSSVRILLVDGGNEFQAIQKPTLNKRIECKFRCLRYGRGESERYLMTVVNAADRRRGFICKWDTATWTLAAKAAVSKRAITALCVSSNGQLLGFGSQDLSVGVVDAATLRLLKTYQEVHGLPPTVVSFDEEAQNLVSASADTTFRMTELPEKYPSGLFTALPSVNYLILVVLALLVLGLGVHIEHEVSNGATLIDVVSSIAAKFEGIGNVTTRPWIMSDEL
ncbi:MAG: WD40-repeat-containing domain protein [Olpidium bornovanus]|uniref:WD40-repeat-containing domain protein n=1 Tax=Olpidium bornovanus TaxID=278681 RepID=A0A8H7ZQR0_9FUNG|nr:MAG: WD40-repeat-containing domain protein [Olpidium bornovanus]